MTGGHRTRRYGSGRLLRVLVAGLILAMIAGAALFLQQSQATASKGIADRFRGRAVLAAHFVSTWADQLMDREGVVAGSKLGGRDVSGAFDSVVGAFGFPAAVLLDSAGRDLAVFPRSSALIGKQIGTKYAHLIQALHGQTAISNVVASAARGTPVIAFAVPFQTPAGRRVFSGAYDVRDTPLSAFMSDFTTLQGAHIYLLDGKNTIVASNGNAAARVESLSDADPALDRAVVARSSGVYRLGSTHNYYVKAPVPGTSWSLLSAAPSSQLFVSVRGSSQWGPWLLLTCLAAIAGLAGWLWLRLYEGRRRLRDANAKLAELASTDVLTAIANRRHITEQLTALLANVRRGSFSLCVLLIDVDHFKRLNDSLGHQAGDQALRHIADTLAGSLREGDFLGRWGGEEFLAVLPGTDLKAALIVADRLRLAIAATPFIVGDNHDLIVVTASIGVAEAAGDSLDELVHRSDLGLYEAKRTGRNAVRVAPALKTGSVGAEQGRLATG